MTFLLQQAAEDVNSCPICTNFSWPMLAALLSVLTLAYLAYGFWRITRNQTRIEEYLKRMAAKDEK